MAFTPTDTGRRIAGARGAAGLSQLALAEALGVPRSGVAALEAGTRALKAEELYILAEILRKPMSYFVTHELREVDFQPLYRLFHADAGGRVAESEVAYAQAAGDAGRQLTRFRDLCERWAELLHFADSAPPEVPEPPRRATHESVPASALADWVRDRFGLDQHAPVLALRTAAEDRFGVQVFVLDDDALGFSGASLHDPAAGACLAVARRSGAHMRFTVAHELAHLLVHRGQAHALGHDRVRAHEIYANAFAAELLMPAPGVRRRVAEDGPVEDAAAVQRLAWHFQVSFPAMAYRLENLRLLTRGWYEGFRAATSGGGGVGRPTEADSWVELPDRFWLLALELVDQERLSTSKFAHLVGLDLDAAATELQRFRSERLTVDRDLV